jgi:hypothetical protein
MKVILEFDCEEDGEGELREALDGGKYRNALQAFDNRLSQEEGRGDAVSLQVVRDWLNAALDSSGADIWD